MTALPRRASSRFINWPVLGSFSLVRFVEQYAWLSLAILLAGAAAFHGFTLLRTPAPFVDEAWAASRAWGLIHQGWPFGVLDTGVMEAYEGYWTFFPWLGPAFQALPVLALGLSWSSIRLTSLIFGMLLLISVYFIGRHLGGPRLGLLAVLIASLSKPFLLSSHLARIDVIVATFGFTAIALYLTDQSRNFSLKSILSGLAVGFTFEIHFHAAIYACALAALYVLDYGHSVLSVRRFWTYVAGVMGGIAVYAALHLLQYPQTYQALVSLIWGHTHTPPILVLNPAVWVQSLLDVPQPFGRAPFMLLAVGLVVLYWNRSRADRTIANLSIVLLLAFAALVRSKWDYYAILISPAFDLVLAAALIKISQARWGRSEWARLAGGIAFTVVLAVSIRNLTPAFSDPMADYTFTVDRISEVVPGASSIIGPQTYWVGLHNHPYFSWEQLVYYQRHAVGSDLSDAFAALSPDILIVDRHLDLFISVDRQSLPAYAQILHIPRGELEEFLNERSQLLTAVETTTFGNVRVYRLNWGHLASQD